jgi:hypothetical protein
MKKSGRDMVRLLPISERCGRPMKRGKGADYRCRGCFRVVDLLCHTGQGEERYHP